MRQRLSIRRTVDRRGFTLIELLVTISVVVILLALFGGAVSAARSSAAQQRTQATIELIDEIVRRHYETCESRQLPSNLTAAQRGAALRRQVTADMPDTWADVQALRGSSEFNLPRHRGYVAAYDAMATRLTPQFEDAECLFMILMQGGISDCVACTALSTARKGDKDNDGAPELWDDWGEPIRFVLWPGGFEQPPGSGKKFFTPTPPFEGDGTTSGRVMRPLIFSAGPDKKGATAMTQGSNLGMASNCGNPTAAPVNTFGGFGPDPSDPRDNRGDNVTNFDREVPR